MNQSFEDSPRLLNDAPNTLTSPTSHGAQDPREVQGTQAKRPVLAAHGVELAYEHRVIAKDLSVEIPPGKVTSIIGPNGCGKSTLLRALSGLLAPRAGEVTYAGKALKQYSRKDFATKVGLLPQTPIAPPGITVADLVARGRHPHQGMFGRWTAADYAAVQEALQVTQLGEFADRAVDELSGGQRQRVWLAMALAQQPETLLLDEPTTYLDVAHQLEVLDLLLDLNHREATTIVMVLHDMNLAARYSDHVIAMRAGQVVAQGAPKTVFTKETMGEVFDIRCEVLPDPVTQIPVIHAYGRHHV